MSKEERARRAQERIARFRKQEEELRKRKRRPSRSTPMFDPVPLGSIRIVQGGAPGMGKKHGKRR
jgi:hypothetical protein